KYLPVGPASCTKRSPTSSEMSLNHGAAEGSDVEVPLETALGLQPTSAKTNPARKKPSPPTWRKSFMRLFVQRTKAAPSEDCAGVYSTRLFVKPTLRSRHIARP